MANRFPDIPLVWKILDPQLQWRIQGECWESTLPPRSNFFHFHTVFSKNLPHNRLAQSSLGSAPLLWEILDPILVMLMPSYDYHKHTYFFMLYVREPPLRVVLVPIWICCLMTSYKRFIVYNIYREKRWEECVLVFLPSFIIINNVGIEWIRILKCILARL